MAEASVKRARVHPVKFGLWIGLGSISMMFVAFTSAYVVRQAAGNWLEFALPDLFYFSTAVILLSSITIELSYRNFKKGDANAYKAFMLLTAVLGAAFIVLQYLGWQQMQSYGIMLTGNPSGSFIYVISGVHVAHVMGGIAALAVALVHAFGIPYFVNAKRKLRFELVINYWHFVDVLWIYLFVFFLLTR